MNKKDQKPKPIDVDKIDLERLKEKTSDLPGLLEYAHHVGGFSVVPTDQGIIKGRAMKAMHEQTQKQMDQIYEQMKLLAKQVNEIKLRADVSHQVYQADINFEPLVGETYYLYEKHDGKKILSLISPAEWKGKCPFKNFIAGVKLLSDHTWDVREKGD